MTQSRHTWGRTKRVLLSDLGAFVPGAVRVVAVWVWAVLMLGATVWAGVSIIAASQRFGDRVGAWEMLRLVFLTLMTVSMLGAAMRMTRLWRRRGHR